MKYKYTKLNTHYRNRDFKKVITLGKSLMNNNSTTKEETKNILRMIGRALDQLAVQASVEEKDEVKKYKLQEEGLKYFEKLKEFDQFEAFRGMATIYHHQGNFKKAIDYYKKAWKINSKNSMIYNDLGNVYQRAWMWEKNETYFNKAIQFYKQALHKSQEEEKKLTPLINMAIINNKIGKKQEAKKYAKKSLKIISEKDEATHGYFIPILKNIIKNNHCL